MAFSETNPAGIGVIGAGNIARRYVEGMARFPQLKLIGVTDLAQPLADKLAAEAGVLSYGSLQDLLRDPQIDVVVNITPPNAHAAVTIEALEAGKHVYVEKPIAATVADSKEMLKSARTNGRLLGSAPDTFLGSAGQTVRAAIDEGRIGEPIAAVAFIAHSKAETWHPDPSFLFAPGGGPALDLGPYYITTLVNSLGAVESVAGFTRIGAPVRTVTSPDRRIDSITVSTPTHVGAVLKFASGVIATVQLSFDVWDHHLPFLEIYGQDGTLTVPDPNEFDGDVTLRGHGSEEWKVLEPVTRATGEPHSPAQSLRGIGVADLVGAIDGLPHRASGALGEHVLEVLEAIQTASDTASVVPIHSSPDRPEPQERLR